MIPDHAAALWAALGATPPNQSPFESNAWAHARLHQDDDEEADGLVKGCEVPDYDGDWYVIGVLPDGDRQPVILSAKDPTSRSWIRSTGGREGDLSSEYVAVECYYCSQVIWEAG